MYGLFDPTNPVSSGAYYNGVIMGMLMVIVLIMIVILFMRVRSGQPLMPAKFYSYLPDRRPRPMAPPAQQMPAPVAQVQTTA